MIILLDLYTIGKIMKYQILFNATDKVTNLMTATVDADSVREAESKFYCGDYYNERIIKEVDREPEDEDDLISITDCRGKTVEM